MAMWYDIAYYFGVICGLTVDLVISFTFEIFFGIVLFLCMLNLQLVHIYVYFTCLVLRWILYFEFGLFAISAHL